ncbi:MAG: hypothetical protein U0793_31315 [Gemmataceae bacterium]
MTRMTWLLGGGALGLAALTVGAYLVSSLRYDHAPATAARPAPEEPHTVQAERIDGAHPNGAALRNGALLQLHFDAVTHFESEPGSGFERFGPVYERVLREGAVPFFSPGELEGDTDAALAGQVEGVHRLTLDHFALRPGTILGLSTMAHERTAASDELKILEKTGTRIWAPTQLDLIGLLTGREPVAYRAESLGWLQDPHGEEALTRPLDDFEFIALGALGKGEDVFARSRDGVIRMLGAVRAKESCLECHSDRKAGDLLGAFSYTLREGVYRRARR